jgi:hypothetical protein
MAEILQDLQTAQPTTGQGSTPWDPGVDIAAGLGICGPEDQIFDRVDPDISAGEAQSLLEAGALVAWDGCGCSSSACLSWLDAESRRALLKAGRPDVQRRARRRFGLLSHWVSVDGIDLVIADCDVRWGHELA